MQVCSLQFLFETRHWGLKDAAHMSVTVTNSVSHLYGLVALCSNQGVISMRTDHAVLDISFLLCDAACVGTHV